MQVYDHKTHYYKSVTCGYYGDEYKTQCGMTFNRGDAPVHVTRIVGEVTCKRCNRDLSSYVMAKNMDRR